MDESSMSSTDVLVGDWHNRTADRTCAPCLQVLLDPALQVNGVCLVADVDCAARVSAATTNTLHSTKDAFNLRIRAALKRVPLNANGTINIERTSVFKKDL